MNDTRSATITIEPAAFQCEGIAQAQGHIRTALRIGKNVEITLRAHDRSDDYDLPNDGTALVEELTLAMEALGENGVAS